MKYRLLGITNWKVSEMGYGMWGMAGWTGSGVSGKTKEAPLGQGTTGMVTMI